MSTKHLSKLALIPSTALLLMALSCTQPKQPATSYPVTGSIEIHDPKALSVIDTSQEIEVLASGFTWAEGPLWVEELQMLLFSDVPENVVWKWTEAEGLVEYLRPSGYTGEGPGSTEPGANGLLLDSQGHLVLCQHGNRQVARMDAPLDAPEPAFTPLAARYDSMRFNSPNDAAFYQDGSLYFTDPPYGLTGHDDDPAKEIPFSGVYKLSDDEVTLLVDSLTRPNGIAFSPDYRTMYVAQSDPAHASWFAYDLDERGVASSGRVFYNATSLLSKEKGLPDGLKVHPNGMIFATGPGGVWVFAPDATVLAKIKTGQGTANCGFDSGYKHLYMTADSLLLRVALKN